MSGERERSRRGDKFSAGIACGGGGACVLTKEVWRRTPERDEYI
jgi:hypothetical protein